MYIGPGVALTAGGEPHYILTIGGGDQIEGNSDIRDCRGFMVFDPGLHSAQIGGLHLSAPSMSGDTQRK